MLIYSHFVLFSAGYEATATVIQRQSILYDYLPAIALRNADYHTEIVGVIKWPDTGRIKLNTNCKCGSFFSCFTLKCNVSIRSPLLSPENPQRRGKKTDRQIIPSAVLNKAILVSILLLIWGIALALIEALQLSAKGSFSTLDMMIFSLFFLLEFSLLWLSELENLGSIGVLFQAVWEFHWIFWTIAVENGGDTPAEVQCGLVLMCHVFVFPKFNC